MEFRAQDHLATWLRVCRFASRQGACWLFFTDSPARRIRRSSLVTPQRAFRIPYMLDESLPSMLVVDFLREGLHAKGVSVDVCCNKKVSRSGLIRHSGLHGLSFHVQMWVNVLWWYLEVTVSSRTDQGQYLGSSCCWLDPVPHTSWRLLDLLDVVEAEVVKACYMICLSLSPLSLSLSLSLCVTIYMYRYIHAYIYIHKSMYISICVYIYGHKMYGHTHIYI